MSTGGSPTPTQNPPAPFFASKSRAVALALLAAAGLVLGGLAIYGHLPIHWPHPPAPAPTPPAPKALATGRFLRYTDVVVQDGPDPAPRPIGQVQIDGSKSVSPHGRIRWQGNDPSVRPITFSPDGSPASSIAQFDVYAYGRHHYHLTAVGGPKDSPVTDTTTISFDLDPPAPPPDPHKPDVPTPKPDNPVPPVPPADPFVALGRGYKGSLGSTYADALEAGAKLLDVGQTRTMAFSTISKQWGDQRAAIFDQQVAPALSRILPESTPDEQVTPAQRAAVSAALKSFAAGLRQP